MSGELGKPTEGPEFEANLRQHLQDKFFNIGDEIPEQIKRVEDTVKYLEKLKKDPIKNATLIEAIEKQLRIENSGNGLKEKIMFNTANTITAKLIDPDFQLVLNRYLEDNKDKTENDYYNEVLNQAFSTVLPLLNTLFQAELGQN